MTDSSRQFYESLRSVVHSEWSRSDDDNFADSLEKAIQERNKRMEKISQLIRQQCQNNKLFLHVKEFIGNFWTPKLTLLVVGPNNSGKTMFVSKLINFDLPSSDENTINTVIRFVHADGNEFKIIDAQGKGYNYTETTESFPEFELLEDKIRMSGEDNDTDSDIIRLIEIGFQSDILGKGIQVVDCPGFHKNENVSQNILNQLYLFKPSIICYVYDYNRGFGERDLEYISNIHESMKKIGCYVDNLDYHHFTQFITIANKCDNFDSNEWDDDDQHQDQITHYSCPSPKLSHQYAHNMSRWKLLNGKRFPIDTYRLLPEILFSSVKLNMSTEINTDANDMLQNLQDTLLMKIVHQSAYLVDLYAHYLVSSQSEQHVDFFYLMKSACVESHFVERIESKYALKESPNFNFQSGYQVYCVDYLETEIQITSISCNDERKKMSLFHDLKYFENSRQTIIYLSQKLNSIFIIDKSMPRSRLIDSLNQFDDIQLQNFIRQIADQHRNLSHYSIRPTFRIDNLYIDKEFDVIYLNRNIPNHSDIKFLLTDGSQIESPKISFDSSQFTIDSNVETVSQIIRNDLSKTIEFFRTFAWFIWILINRQVKEVTPDAWRDNPEENIEEMLTFLRQKGKNFPKYLCYIMRMCWTIRPSEGLEKLLKFWNNRVCPIIDANMWLKSKSSHIDAKFAESLELECSNNNNLLLDFTGGMKIFGCKYSDAFVQVTSMPTTTFSSHYSSSQFDDTDSSIEETIYERMHHDDKANNLLLLVYADESKILLIDKHSYQSRLLDELENCSLENIQLLIENVAKQFDLVSSTTGANFKLISNFRADCLFVDKTCRAVSINRNIPNSLKFPFLLKNRIPAPNNCHIHPDLMMMMQVKRNFGFKFSKQIVQRQRDAVEFLYSFGLFVWLMIEGTGTKCPPVDEGRPLRKSIGKRINALRQGRFSEYPDNLKTVMIICWSVEVDDDFKILHQCWRDCLSLLLKENVMVNDYHGYKLLPSLQRRARMPANPYDDEYYDRYHNSVNVRGICLIICNEFFTNHCSREGAQADRAMLADIFSMLRYKVIMRDNLSSWDIKENIFDLVSNKHDHSQYDSLIVCIMTHGNEGSIFGSDGYSIKLKDLLDPLYRCETLRGKPKLIFHQACRGGANVQSVGLFRDDGGSNSAELTSDAETISAAETGRNISYSKFTAFSLEADFLLAQSTIPKHASFRSINAEGSYFIQTLATDLVEVGKSSDIMRILTSVTRKVNEKAYEEMKCHQIATFESRLFKLFKFL